MQINATEIIMHTNIKKKKYEEDEDETYFL